MLPLHTTLLLLFLTPLVVAGDVHEGGACSVNNNKLQIGTYEFSSDCDFVTYCNPKTNKCEKKGCRRSEFPLGYPTNAALPPRCEAGKFCPDEEDSCQDKLPVGSDCQLNRDDECQPPPNAKELSDKSGHGLNVDGAVCLNFQCTWANVTLGLPCVVENTAYISYGAHDEYIDIVSRDNCQIGLYCDTTQKVCIQQKDVGAQCDADKECFSYNCGAGGKCDKDVSQSNKLPVWVYVIVGISIFGGMFSTLFGLFFLHGKQREAEREKRMQYWREQTAFRQNILQAKESARGSFLSQGSVSGRSSVLNVTRDPEGSSDESYSPILQHPFRAVEIRQPTPDDRDDGSSAGHMSQLQPQSSYKGGRL